MLGRRRKPRGGHGRSDRTPASDSSGEAANQPKLCGWPTGSFVITVLLSWTSCCGQTADTAASCTPSTRARRELDPDAPRYGADEVIYGRARAGGLRRELERDAGMVANAVVDGGERRLVRDCERKMVQADIGLAVEGDRVCRIGHTPKGQGHAAVGDEHGRVRIVPGHLLEAQSAAEEARGLVEVANGEADVVHAVRQSVIQRFPPFRLSVGQ